jgi:GT2 family glycosyltransferase
MDVSVVVPTYRRPQALMRCIRALRSQTLQPHEVIVVMRRDDLASRSVEENLVDERVVLVDRPGTVCAMNAGLREARGEIVAFTDDDAAPASSWLASLAAPYAADPTIGGVGGRDVVDGETGPRRPVVGKMQWFGRCIGNHHLGYGPPRFVDVLKGVNMSFRREAVAGLHFDERLRGSGAQVGLELAFCLAVRRRGWRLLYDPEILVDHFPDKRFDEDARHRFVAIAVENAAYNDTLCVFEHLSVPCRLAFIIWAYAVGTRSYPGLAQIARLIVLGERHAWARFASAARGRTKALLHLIVPAVSHVPGARRRPSVRG